MSGALPTFVIIGAQKSGTTALHAYLSRHPDVSMSRPKELDFFVADGNWSRGVEWYRDRWDPSKPVRGESSPNYTAHPQLSGVPERMAGLLPDAKLIFMVRDPVRRARASYIHAYSNRVEHRPMATAMFDPAMAYLSRSRYHLQLTRYLEHYPMESILLLEQEELLGDRRATLERVFSFIGARDDYWRDAFTEPRLETSTRRRRTRLGAFTAKRLKMRYWRRIRDHWPFTTPFEQPELDDELAERIAAELRDDISAFRELTGRRFAHWSV